MDPQGPSSVLRQTYSSDAREEQEPTTGEAPAVPWRELRRGRSKSVESLQQPQGAPGFEKSGSLLRFMCTSSVPRHFLQGSVRFLWTVMRFAGLICWPPAARRRHVENGCICTCVFVCISLSLSLSISPFVCLSIYLPTYLSVSSSIYLSIYLSVVFTYVYM